MNPNFLAIFSSETIGLVLKVVEVIIGVLFLIYSLLTIRQVGIMNHSLVTPVVGPIVKILALLQLSLGVIVLLAILVS